MSTAASVLPRRQHALPAPLAFLVAQRARSVGALPVRSLCLDPGSVLRIEDGAGTLVHVRRGIVWITEENSLEDVFVTGGQAHRLSCGGMTIVSADRTSRIVLAFARGGAPRRIEIAPAAGESGRVVPLLAQRRRSTLRSLVHAVRSRCRALRAWWNAPREDPFRLHSPRHVARWQEDDFTPEAVRARLMNSSPFPYY